MNIYEPRHINVRRIDPAEKILKKIPFKHCFITGSFLYKENYNDIDVFIITRTKIESKIKNLESINNKINIHKIDFNDLYSLYYHSISHSCVSKEILPTKPLKVTLSDYWKVINEAIPTLINQKETFQKEVRFLVLYTEYFRNGQILDSLSLDQKIQSFKDYKEVLKYVKENIPEIIKSKIKKSYLKRFFYTQAGQYKDLRDYDAQDFLYELTHDITRGKIYG